MFNLKCTAHKKRHISPSALYTGVFQFFHRRDKLDIAIYDAKMIKHTVHDGIIACLHENGKKTRRCFPFQ